MTEAAQAYEALFVARLAGPPEADLRGWLPVVGIALSEDTIGRVLAAGDAALGGCVSKAPAGVEFDLSAHIVSASH